MHKIYFTLFILFLSPILIPVMIVESTIVIPISLYAFVRLKMKKLG